MDCNEFTIIMPDDLHAHFREEESTSIHSVLLRDTVPLTARMAARGLAMPNTKKPIKTGRDIERYYYALRKAGGPEFHPLMTAKLTQGSKPSDVREWVNAGAVAVKLYPEGVTNNSDDAITDITRLEGTLHAIKEAGLVLCVHAETPGAFCLDREAHYCKATVPYLAHFGGRVIVEHLSSEVGVKTVLSLGENVAATITPQHLWMTLDHVLGDGLRPHNFCLPVAKRPEDRTALIRAATSGNPKFFLGTDTAPHVREQKENAKGCAGAFVAPAAMSILAKIFENEGVLERLEAFTSEYGARFYGMTRNRRTLTMVRKPYVVPHLLGHVVPFLGGETLEWSIAT